MAINFESVREFFKRNSHIGKIEVYAPEATVTILKDGTTDTFSLIEKATTFSVDGKRYTREEFDQLLQEKSK